LAKNDLETPMIKTCQLHDLPPPLHARQFKYIFEKIRFHCMDCTVREMFEFLVDCIKIRFSKLIVGRGGLG